MPGRAEGGTGFGGSAVEDVGIAEIEPGAAVELAASGDSEVGGEDDLRPWAGTCCGRRVGERRAVEVFKGGVAEERDDAGLGGRACDQRLSSDWIGRTHLWSWWDGDDLRSGGADGDGCEEEKPCDGRDGLNDARGGDCVVHVLHSLGLLRRTISH